MRQAGPPPICGPFEPDRVGTLSLARIRGCGRGRETHNPVYPEYPNTYRWLAAALGQLGRFVEAKVALEKAIAIAPPAFDMYLRRRPPWIRPEDHAHMLEGLRKAGLPDE